MSTYYLKSGDGYSLVSIADVYRFKGVTFQWHNYLGAMLCRKDGEPSKRSIGRKSEAVINQWLKLPKAKREKTRIYG